LNLHARSGCAVGILKPAPAFVGRCWRARRPALRRTGIVFCEATSATARVSLQISGQRNVPSFRHRRVPVGLFWCGIAYAADPAHRPGPAKVRSRPPPRSCTQAVVGNPFEVESSKLALDRSQNATVKTFAKSMADDHSAASVKLADAVD
jgi:hypothetical protein